MKPYFLSISIYIYLYLAIFNTTVVAQGFPSFPLENERPLYIYLGYLWPSIF